jgi:putative transposase
MTTEKEIQNSELVSVTPITCKDCGSTDVVRFGTLKGVQRYWCKSCKRKFVNNNALPSMRIPKDQIALAVSEYFNGSSINAIRRNLKQQYSIEPSQSTVHEWIMEFAKKAIKESSKANVKVGDVWIADETVLHRNWGGKKRRLWLIDIIDRDTRFLLASYLSENRGTKQAERLMELAAKRAGKAPKVVITDKLASYLDGIELTFGADTEHIQSLPFSKEDDTNVIERFQGTIKDRTKVLRGFKTVPTARLILDGFLIHYNFFRPHESLKNKTPAEVAKADFPYKSWKDVVMANAKKVETCASS